MRTSLLVIILLTLSIPSFTELTDACSIDESSYDEDHEIYYHLIITDFENNKVEEINTDWRWTPCGSKPEIFQLDNENFLMEVERNKFIRGNLSINGSLVLDEKTFDRHAVGIINNSHAFHELGISFQRNYAIQLYKHEDVVDMVLTDLDTMSYQIQFINASIFNLSNMSEQPEYLTLAGFFIKNDDLTEELIIIYANHLTRDTETKIGKFDLQTGDLINYTVINANPSSESSYHYNPQKGITSIDNTYNSELKSSSTFIIDLNLNSVDEISGTAMGISESGFYVEDKGTIYTYDVETEQKTSVTVDNGQVIVQKYNLLYKKVNEKNYSRIYFTIFLIAVVIVLLYKAYKWNKFQPIDNEI